MMLLTMAMQQLIYGERCIQALAITEGGFPYDQCMNVGLQIGVPDDMIRQWQEVRIQRRMGAYTTEDIAHFKKKVGDFWIIRGSSGEEILTNVLKAVATKACSIIGIDSLQGLQPSVDADKEMDENEKRAAHAAMIGRFFKKYIPLTTGLNGVNETTLIATQQVRSNAEKATAPAHIQKYLKDWAVQGSYAAKHFKLIDLVMHDGSLVKKGEGESRETLGKTIKWYTEKGKAGTHDNIHGETTYRYDVRRGIDLAQTVMDTAMARGVLRQVGKSYTLIRPETGEILNDYSAPSLKAFKKCLEMDFSFEKAVRLEILASAGIQCLYQ
jgi:hypothetical protein